MNRYRFGSWDFPKEMAFRRTVKRGCAVHPSATVRPLQEEDSLIQFMRLEDALIVNDDFVKQIADELIAAKGVKHGKLTVTTTGKNLPS